MSMRRERLELDSSVRRSSNGTALIGGSPFRLVRLSPAGARLVDAWLAAAPIESSAEAEALRRRLLRAGMLHPVVEPGGGQPSVAIVVPVHDDAAGLAELLAAVRRELTTAPIVVVDDASPPPTSREIGAVAERFGASVLGHAENRGPGAARNTGWRHVVAAAGEPPEVVIFLDADVVPSPGAIGTLLTHLQLDEALAAVAPRVRARPGTSLLDRYESTRSPLDLGDQPALVAPGSPISYVPSAALAVRTTCLTKASGFDEAMRVGEDVDLVWRIVADDHLVRYDPAAIVHHRNRPSFRAAGRQRHGYGSSAAELAGRHRGGVAPVELSARMFATWLAILFGGRVGRVLAAAGFIDGSTSLARTLAGSIDHPMRFALRLNALAHAHAGRWLATAATRAWLPLMLLRRRTRTLAATAVLLPATVDWLRRRPAIDPVTYAGLRALDDVAYCSGVWTGALRSGSPDALLPRVRFPERARPASTDG